MSRIAQEVAELQSEVQALQRGDDDESKPPPPLEIVWDLDWFGKGRRAPGTENLPRYCRTVNNEIPLPDNSNVLEAWGDAIASAEIPPGSRHSSSAFKRRS